MGDAKGLIDPSAFHPTSVELKRGAHPGDGTIRLAGKALGDLGERVADHAVTVDSRWAGLAGCYQAPEGERVLGLVGPAATAAEDVRDALVGVRSALEVYADALWGVAERLAVLEAEAAEFRISDEVLHGVTDTGNDAWTVANGVFAAGHGDLGGGWKALGRVASDAVPWYEDQAMVAKNDDYWDRLYRCQQDIEEAAWACSTMICQVAAPQAASQALSAGVDTTEQIAAFDAAQGWGRPRDRGLLPGEQAWDSLNSNLLAPTAALAFGWDTTSRAGFARTWGNGADALRARDEARSQTWGGMVDVVAAFAVGYAARSPYAQDMLDARYGEGWTDQRRQVVADTALSLIAYDPSVPEDPWHAYRDAPYGAATTLAVNAAGLVAGPKALGALGKTAATGRAGLTAARTADTPPSAALRAAETAADGRAAASTALENAARRPVTHPPHLPKVSDTIRKPGDTTPGTKSLLYQDHPEPPPTQRTHTQTGEPAPVPAEPTRTPTSRPASSNPHSPAPGRTADTVTTQPITGLPRLTTEAPGPLHDALGRAETAEPGSGPAHTTLDRPTGDQNAGRAGAGSTADARAQPGTPSRLWDPSEPVVRTIPSSDPRAPRYSEAEAQRTWDQAPVNEHGQRVDHRTGVPLAETRSDGSRGWHMTWDPEGESWMAERPGAGHDDGMPQRGEPGSWGYDENGDLLRYAERRPSYGPTQVEDVWQSAPKRYDETGREYVEVSDPDDNLVRIYTDERYPRSKVWDMGHIDGLEYWRLRERYMSGTIDEESFLLEFRNADNYTAQHWLRNRSHMDETPRDRGGDLIDYDEWSDGRDGSGGGNPDGGDN